IAGLAIAFSARSTLQSKRWIPGWNSGAGHTSAAALQLDVRHAPPVDDRANQNDHGHGLVKQRGPDRHDEQQSGDAEAGLQADEKREAAGAPYRSRFRRRSPSMNGMPETEGEERVGTDAMIELDGGERLERIGPPGLERQQ